MTEISIKLEGINPIDFFGAKNTHFNTIKRAFPKLRLASRGNLLRVQGSEEDIVFFETKINEIIHLLSQRGKLSKKDVEFVLEGIHPSEIKMPDFPDDIILHGPKGNAVKARTANQKRLVNSAGENDILFAMGPAGTGKTYTAVALAVRALKNKTVRKIILTRPAVEAGESLGFLPGDLKEKIDPYLRPLYDALDDMLPPDKLSYYTHNRIIEVAPLAYMRGRTLDHAFVILDEAQNTTESQIKMFLTRLGPSAKCIITGDMTQIDLPKNQKSGLVKTLAILENIEGIGMIALDSRDVIRHHLVKKIIDAFENADE